MRRQEDDGTGIAETSRVTLELGGNDAAILLKDAIIDDTHMDRLSGAIFDTTGQICMNAKRVYVHCLRMDEGGGRAASAPAEDEAGYGLDKDTPRWVRRIRLNQKKFVDELIAEARPPAPRCWSSASCRAATIEGRQLRAPGHRRRSKAYATRGHGRVFGPVIPIIPFDTEQEAIAAANKPGPSLTVQSDGGRRYGQFASGGQLVRLCG
ncbi:MAG: aldehyde dehydrogenase family protein [Proteobacteria bacterium]|nr:aldehyde dehydrogenase family protein [Pseudomonadota bacterium]